jgi:hypothetical protein
MIGCVARRQGPYPMMRPSFVPRLLVLQLGAIFLLLSCASTRPPQKLRVRVAPGFSGTVRLAPCDDKAPAGEVSTDAQGVGNTAACPGQDGSVSIVIVQAGREYTAAASDVAIRRTGDGIATSIEIRLHP